MDKTNQKASTFNQWSEIKSFPRRNITPEKLAKDLEKLEEEVE